LCYRNYNGRTWLKDLSRNEWDIDLWVYWKQSSPKWDLGCVIQILWGIGFPKSFVYWKTKTLLENSLRCVIQILWGIGFPKCVDLLENKNPFGKLFGKLFTMCYTNTIGDWFS
jgi:hypothetical protein